MAVSKVKRKLWREDSMLEAVKSIEDNGKGLHEAACIYNVPVETLRRRVIGVTPPDAKPGRDTILTGEEERRLAQYGSTDIYAQTYLKNFRDHISQ